MGLLDIKAGAIVDYERVVGHQVFEVLPAVDVLEAIGAKDDGELLQRELFYEVCEGVYGERGLWEMELDVAGAEPCVVFNGELDEVEAVVFVEQGMGVL